MGYRIDSVDLGAVPNISTNYVWQKSVRRLYGDEIGSTRCSKSFLVALGIFHQCERQQCFKQERDNKLNANTKKVAGKTVRMGASMSRVASSFRMPSRMATA